ncbi:MAG TPA: hypothetical protein VFT24_09515 [Vicinamibacterales bacterium]|nr:hypothetical protein [Vicinamibacterales bacterium]
MDVNALVQNASVTLVAAAWKVAGAAALFLVGRWLISFAMKLLNRALATHHFDVTLTKYMQTALRIVLNGEAGYPSPMPTYAVSGMLAGPPLDMPR